MAAYAVHTTTKSTHLPTAQTKIKQQEPHKRAYLSENGGLGIKRSGECAKSRKGHKTERTTGLGRRTRGRFESGCCFRL